MEFTKVQKEEIISIIKKCTSKDACLHELKLYLTQFKDVFRSEGLDYAVVAYTIWNEYANKGFI